MYVCARARARIYITHTHTFSIREENNLKKKFLGVFINKVI